MKIFGLLKIYSRFMYLHVISSFPNLRYLKISNVGT